MDHTQALAAKAEFQVGEAGHTSEALEQLFSSPYHAASMLINAHLVSTAFLHIRFDQKESQR